MNKEAVVSIIVPFYNRHDLVVVALKNISLQTYKDIEVILIDDGSDNVLTIDNDFGLDIQVNRLEENKGPGNARRVGRQMAKGKYICYLDSDDWWSDNFIEECVNVIESDPELGMVYTNTNTILKNVKVDCRVKKNVPKHILPPLLLYDKRFWSTTSCMWRCEVSLADHWRGFRNHEDYIHDILSSKINNNIRFVEHAVTFKNQSAPNRILRDSKEVRKALNEIIKINKSYNLKGVSYFYLNRVYKNKIKIQVNDLPKVLRLPTKEFRVFSRKWILFYLLIFLNIAGVKQGFQKRNIKNLKK